MSETNASKAYQHLRQRLIAGDYEPGTRLLYGPIGNEIGVSATPVREAAGRLANEGLVDLVPQLGAVVRRLSQQDLLEIYEVREIIEPAAAALAAKRANTEQLEAITQQNDVMRQCLLEHTKTEEVAGHSVVADQKMKAAFDLADYQFHLKIFEATGNQPLLRTASQSHVLTLVFGIRKHQHDGEAMRRTCSDHQAIVDAIRQGDPDAARAAASDHIRNGLQSSLKEFSAMAGEK